VISHRPATILWADRILVVDEGAIVDSGRHDQLVLRCEAYRRIWQSQDHEMPSTSLQALKRPPITAYLTSGESSTAFTTSSSAHVR
jgi:ABC-type uncharacterized transport system ATPase subunit